jgi:hypothetical protein
MKIKTSRIFGRFFVSHKEHKEYKETKVEFSETRCALCVKLNCNCFLLLMFP